MEYHSPKCKGVMKIIVGVLILLNAFFGTWLGIDGWIKFFAVLMILGGIIKLFHPYCKTEACCSSVKPVMAAKKTMKKKR